MAPQTDLADTSQPKVLKQEVEYSDSYTEETENLEKSTLARNLAIASLTVRGLPLTFCT